MSVSRDWDDILEKEVWVVWCDYCTIRCIEEKEENIIRILEAEFSMFEEIKEEHNQTVRSDVKKKYPWKHKCLKCQDKEKL
jgi:hypothetical protein